MVACDGGFGGEVGVECNTGALILDAVKTPSTLANVPTLYRTGGCNSSAIAAATEATTHSGHLRTHDAKHPSINAVRGLLSYQYSTALPINGERYLADMQQSLNEMTALPTEQLMQRLHSETGQLSALLAFAPANLPTSHTPWRFERWCKLFKQLPSIGAIDPQYTTRICRQLFPAQRKMIGGRLLEGQPPLPSQSTIEVNDDLRLVY